MTPNKTRPDSHLALGHYLNKDNRALWTSYRNLNEELPSRVNDRIMEAHDRTYAKSAKGARPHHFMLNANPKDRHITREEWEKMADAALAHMGLSDHLVKFVEHPDALFEGKPRQHIHLMVSARNKEGKAWRTRSKRNAKNQGSGDYKWKSKMDELCRSLENDFELIPLDTPLTAYREGREWKKGRTPNRAEREIDERTRRTPDVPMDKADVKAIAPQAKAIIAAAGSWDEIQQNLAAELGFSMKAKGPGLILSGEGGKYAKLSELGKVKLAGQEKAERLSKGKIALAVGETWEEYWERSQGVQDARKKKLKSDTYLSDKKEERAGVVAVPPKDDDETTSEHPKRRFKPSGTQGSSGDDKVSEGIVQSKEQDKKYQQQPNEEHLPLDISEAVDPIPTLEFSDEDVKEWRKKLHDSVALARTWDQLETIGKHHSLRLGGGWSFHDGTHFLPLSAIDGLSLKRRQKLYRETYAEYVYRKYQSFEKSKTVLETGKYDLKPLARRDLDQEDEQEM